MEEIQEGLFFKMSRISEWKLFHSGLGQGEMKHDRRLLVNVILLMSVLVCGQSYISDNII